MSTFQAWHDYTPTINSAAHALFAVCRQVCTNEQLKQWRQFQANPNDFMDANAIVIEILRHHEIDVFDDADGAHISESMFALIDDIFAKASQLNHRFYAYGSCV